MVQPVKRLPCKSEDQTADPQHPHKSLIVTHLQSRFQGVESKLAT